MYLRTTWQPHASNTVSAAQFVHLAAEVHLSNRLKVALGWAETCRSGTVLAISLCVCVRVCVCVCIGRLLRHILVLLHVQKKRKVFGTAGGFSPNFIQPGDFMKIDTATVIP